MSWGDAQREGKERAARQRRERAQKLENYHYTTTAGAGPQIGRQFTFDEVMDASCATARRLGYTLVLHQGSTERSWIVRAVKL